MGFTSKEIASELGLTYKTILAHFRRIRKALDVHSTLEILKFINSVERKGNLENIILTPRGIEVFTLFLQGLTNQDIACRLDVTLNTVRRHKEYMLSKNNCATMTELLSKYYGEHDTQRFMEFTDA